MTTTASPSRTVSPARALPRLALASLPTPLHRFDRLAKAIGSRAFLVKREDLSGLGLGGNKARQLEVILAEANQRSEEIRGEGDAKRNEIYANAYGRDPEFFRFQRALIACEAALKKGTTQIVVAPDNLGLCDEFIAAARKNSK